MARNERLRAVSGGRLASRGAAAGFTLIELAIVGVCIAILAAMAVTSFEYATVKSRRASAQGCLTEHSQFMERYYTTHMTYQDAPDPTCSSDVTDHYKVTFSVTPSAAGYTLEAKPEGRQEKAEKDCGTMTIDQVGRKTPTSGCW